MSWIPGVFMSAAGVLVVFSSPRWARKLSSLILAGLMVYAAFVTFDGIVARLLGALTGGFIGFIIGYGAYKASLAFSAAYLLTLPLEGVGRLLVVVLAFLGVYIVLDYRSREGLPLTGGLIAYMGLEMLGVGAAPALALVITVSGILKSYLYP
ncbi:MAG: hypothetical protein GSR86_07680 [Desulfurococcales archaeon]|nr:hypothetical protein [Desulfurococcales archaeon]